MRKIFNSLLKLLPLQVTSLRMLVIHASEPGTVFRLIGVKKKYQITSLKVVGKINKKDIQYICDMAGCGTKVKHRGKLSKLDLSEAEFNNTLASYLFSNCNNLQSITIPQNTTTIEANAFYGCTRLTTIIVPEQNKYYADIDGVLFNKEKNDLVFYPKGRAGAYTIPNCITELRASIFQNCKQLTSIVIPESVTTIRELAFADCFRLKEIHCLALHPPKCQNYSCFEGINKTSCTLRIPEDSYSNYWLSQTWAKFINIKEKKV